MQLFRVADLLPGSALHPVGRARDQQLDALEGGLCVAGERIGDRGDALLGHLDLGLAGIPPGPDEHEEGQRYGEHEQEVTGAEPFLAGGWQTAVLLPARHTGWAFLLLAARDHTQ